MFKDAQAFLNRYLDKVYPSILENDDLSQEQKELLLILIKSEVYFIVFSHDDDWENKLTAGKIDFVTALLDGAWKVDFSYSLTDFDMFELNLGFKNEREFLGVKSTAISVYLTFTDMMKIINAKLFGSEHFLDSLLCKIEA